MINESYEKSLVNNLFILELEKNPKISLKHLNKNIKNNINDFEIKNKKNIHDNKISKTNSSRNITMIINHLSNKDSTKADISSQPLYTQGPDIFKTKKIKKYEKAGIDKSEKYEIRVDNKSEKHEKEGENKNEKYEKKGENKSEKYEEIDGVDNKSEKHEEVEGIDYKSEKYEKIEENKTEEYRVIENINKKCLCLRNKEKNIEKIFFEEGIKLIREELDIFNLFINSFIVYKKREESVNSIFISKENREYIENILKRTIKKNQ